MSFLSKIHLHQISFHWEMSESPTVDKTTPSINAVASNIEKIILNSANAELDLFDDDKPKLQKVDSLEPDMVASNDNDEEANDESNKGDTEILIDEEEEEEEEEEEDEDAVTNSNNSSELTASEEDETTWITWFCSLKGNDFFCKIDEDYIQDDFNLTGLSALVPYYDYALDMMLDVDIPIENLSDEQQEMIETAAEVLYGLIHARFILTSRGMQRMYEKYVNVDFGRCPRVYCQGQMVLPVGLSDVPRQYSANIYCPRCQELYYPRSSRQANLDGSFFGTTFPHIFLLQHPECIPARNEHVYVPRIYGFRINRESQYYKPPQLQNSQRPNTRDRSKGKDSASTSANPTSESQRERDRRR